jgi:uncharacterized membrane protein YoaK (UPF0700 family)
MGQQPGPCDDGGRPAHLRRGIPPLLLLTGAAAATDSVCYLGLGKVFPANMTGNTVLLATGIAGGQGAAAWRSAVALGGFVVGAAVAALFPRSDEPFRLSRLVPLAAELGMLLGAVFWWSVRAPGTSARLVLIALFGTAMGMQSAVVSRLGVGVSTTYITGTWTAVSGWLARTIRPATSGAEGTAQGDRWRQVMVVLTYFGAALLTGYLFLRFGVVAAWVPPGLLGIGLLASLFPRRSVTASGGKG